MFASSLPSPAETLYLSRASRPGSRGPQRRKAAGRGKSGLHGKTVPDNVRRGRPQGKCHRKQTAPPPGLSDLDGRGGGVRVKGWGKSPPRDRQRKRHGKPHREQDRIGTTRRKPAFSRSVVRVGCLRRAAMHVPEEWLPRSCFGRGHTEPGLQAGWRLSLNRSARPLKVPRAFSFPGGVRFSAPVRRRPGFPARRGG